MLNENREVFLRTLFQTLHVFLILLWKYIRMEIPMF